MTDTVTVRWCPANVYCPDCGRNMYISHRFDSTKESRLVCPCREAEGVAYYLPTLDLEVVEIPDDG